MGKALNLLLGSVATALVSVGVAAQTGTVRWPTFNVSPGTGAVHAQQATVSPSIEPGSSPSPTQAPSPPPLAAPPVHKKHGH